MCSGALWSSSLGPQKGKRGDPGPRGHQGKLGQSGERGKPGNLGDVGLPGDPGEPGYDTNIPTETQRRMSEFVLQFVVMGDFSLFI